MLRDERGRPAGSDSGEALAALQRGLESFDGFRADAMVHLDAAIAADPDFALPYAIKGILLVGLRKPELYPAIRSLLETARAGRPPGSRREELYLKALEAGLAGRLTEAAALYEAIAQADPLDLFALRQAQFELFWMGEVAWMRDISERAAAAWSAASPGLANFLAVRSFGLEETGAYAEAERCGREAIALDPAQPWAAHAVAHVLIMQGRLEEGIDWCRSLSGNWAQANHIRHHNWWHLALFLAEAGDYAAALAIYDERLRDLDSPLMRAIPDYHIDIQNDVALLQRLELRGLAVGGRWDPVADLAAARIGNHASPFTSAHCVLALAAAGRFAEADETLAAIRDFVAADRSALGPRYALAGLPAAEAALAHRRGDHRRVLELLVPARRSLWQMGGSHAQRDLFMQLLADSALRLGRRDLLALLFAELRSLGFAHLEERSSYAAACGGLQ